MKAAICKSLEGPQALVIEDVADPVAAAGQVVVRVKAAGLNFADTLITRGKYQFKPELPFSPGAEIAGVIDTIGAGVNGFSVGQRVMAYVNWGGAAEKISVDETALVAIPDDVSDTIAAGISVTYGTAMHGLRDRGRLKPDESVVVTGAAGGIAIAAAGSGGFRWRGTMMVWPGVSSAFSGSELLCASVHSGTRLAAAMLSMVSPRRTGTRTPLSHNSTSVSAGTR